MNITPPPPVLKKNPKTIFMDILIFTEQFSTELLSSIKLNYTICLFSVCEQLTRGPIEHSLALIRNPSFPVHPSLVSALTTLYACISEWSRNPSMPRFYLSTLIMCYLKGIHRYADRIGSRKKGTV